MTVTVWRFGQHVGLEGKNTEFLQPKVLYGSIPAALLLSAERGQRLQ
jgi:hypothetical protein